MGRVTSRVLHTLRANGATDQSSVRLPAGDAAAGAQPGVIHRWRQRCGEGGGGDVSDDGQRFFQSVVCAQNLLAPLHLLLRLVHQCVLVSGRVQLRQELCVNEVLHLRNSRRIVMSSYETLDHKTSHKGQVLEN